MKKIIYFLKNIKFTRHDSFFDMWSIIHLFTGMIMGLSFSVFDFPLYYISFFVFLSLVFWEIYEFFKKTGESICNSISDIFIGIIGFFLSYKIIYNYDFDSKIIVLILFLILNSIMIVWGKSTKKKLK